MTVPVVCRLSPAATLRGKVLSLPAPAPGASNACAPGCTEVLAFLGVPYAQPPVNENRFQPPKEALLWQGKRDAQEFGPICPQNLQAAARTYFPHPVPSLVDEDCLYLNIYTPALAGSRPVMVWIHGGAFIQGFSNFYDGRVLAARHGVVVVTVNYRLGPFGFLCSGDGIVRGNMGLLDQLEALRWIRKHIAGFGGDPGNVTLFGESAGGISLSLHLLSPMARGLFHRVICESGVATHPNSVWTPGQAAKYVSKRLKQTGEMLSGKVMVQILATKSSEEIVKLLGDGFTPVVDGTYLPDLPLTLYTRGAFNLVDLMVGFTSHEGASFVFNLTKSHSISSKLVARQLVERVVKKMFFRGKPNSEKIIEAIMDFYLKDATDGANESITRGLVDMYGDLLFTASSIQVADAHAARGGHVFMYDFTHRPPYSSAPDFVKADHGHEIVYVFGEPFLGRFPDVWRDEDKHLSTAMMKMWTDFAREGHPGQSWPVYTSSQQNCLSLEADIRVKPTPHRDAAKFWNETIAKLSEGSPLHSAKM